MYDLTNMISYGIAGIVCAHIASERGWTDEWKTVKRIKKRTPNIRKVIMMSTEPTKSSSDECDSAIVMSDWRGDSSNSTESSDSGDSTEDEEIPWHKKCTSPNNPFACLDYFLDWDEAPDDFLIHLAGVDFIDKQDPWLNDTSDVWLDLECPAATYQYEIYEEIDRPLQQAKFRIMEEEEALEEAARSAACTMQAPLESDPDVDAAGWTFPEAWDELDTYDSISVCGFKWRHEASFGTTQEDTNPEYRDIANAGLMSPLERKERLDNWLMASEHYGRWQLSSSENDPANLFQLHLMKTQHYWGTSTDESWEYEEDEELFSEEGSDEDDECNPFRVMTVWFAQQLMARGRVVEGNWGDVVCVGLWERVMAVRARYGDAYEHEILCEGW